MTAASMPSAAIARLGALLADPTRAEILCALMSGRAHTGSELARHVGVAPSTVSEHLGKLLDGDIVNVEAQGRHRYWRLADARVAELLESLGAHATRPADPRAPADLAYARTCYDHLAGELAVRIYDQLLTDGHLAMAHGALTVTPGGFEFLSGIGVDTGPIDSTHRPPARPCLDWTERRHHLAGAAGKQLLVAFRQAGWVVAGDRPRSLRITQAGRTEIARSFGLASC